MKRLGCGGVLIFIGLFMLLGLVSGDALQEGSLASNLVMAILFTLAPIVGGGFMIRSHFMKKRKALKEQQTALQRAREKQILRLAQQKGGRISIPEIVVDTSMSTEEAEEFMQDLTAKGYVDMQVTDSGVIVYEFYEIAHRNRLEE